MTVLQNGKFLWPHMSLANSYRIFSSNYWNSKSRVVLVSNMSSLVLVLNFRLQWRSFLSTDISRPLHCRSQADEIFLYRFQRTTVIFLFDTCHPSPLVTFTMATCHERSCLLRDRFINYYTNWKMCELKLIYCKPDVRTRHYKWLSSHLVPSNWGTHVPIHSCGKLGLKEIGTLLSHLCHPLSEKLK